MKSATAILTSILLLLVAWSSAEEAEQTSKQPFVPKEFPIEHASVDELVSLSSGTPFSQGLFILSKFSNKFEKKVIIDPEKHKGNIGVDIENMHWKKAFEMILRANGLWYISYDTYYEITEPKAAPDKKDDDGKKKISPNDREVRIQAIFFEANRDLLRELGVDWSSLRSGNLFVGAAQGGALPVSEDMLSVFLSRTFDNGRISVDALIKTLESTNTGRLIANPTVVCVEGQHARIQAGQDFAVHTRDFAGNIITEFYSTGSIMTVTPSIVTGKEGEEFIHLKLAVENSSLADPVNITINKNITENSLMLYDSEERAIAGLYSVERKVVRKGFPFLKDLPWWVLGLRYITGFNHVESNEKEQVVLLRAQLLPKLDQRFAEKGETHADFDNMIDDMHHHVKPLMTRPITDKEKEKAAK